MNHELKITVITGTFQSEVSAPFVTLHCGPASDWSNSSRTFESSKSFSAKHFWNEEFSLDVKNLETDIVEFRVLEKAKPTPDHPPVLFWEGSFLLPLGSLFRQETLLFEVRDSNFSGTLSVQVIAFNFGQEKDVGPSLPSGVSLVQEEKDPQPSHPLCQKAEIRHPLSSEKGWIQSLADVFFWKSSPSMERLKVEFQLPETEQLVGQYLCNFVAPGGVLCWGRIFLFEEHFCFLFEYESCQIVLRFLDVGLIAIPVDDVSKPGVFSLQMETLKSVYLFNGFSSGETRDEIFRISSFVANQTKHQARHQYNTFGMLGNLKYPEKQKEMMEVFIDLVPPNELLVESFSNCSFWSGPSRWVGCLFLSTSYASFAYLPATFFDPKKVVVPLDQVVAVQKTTSFGYPAVVLITKTDEYFFSFSPGVDAVQHVLHTWFHQLTRSSLISRSYTIQEIQTLYADFDNCDKEKSGKVSLVEFLSLDLGPPGVSNRVFRSINNGSNEKMCFVEYCKGMLTLMKGTPIERLKLSFGMFEGEKHGKVSKAGLMSVLSELSLVSPDVASINFDQLDTDADGIISIEDYLKLLENPQLQQNFGIDLSRDIITDPRKGGFLHLSVIQKLLNGIKLSTCAPVSPRPRGKSRPTSPQKSRPTSPRNSRPTSPQKSRPSSGKRNSRKLGEPGENLLLAPPGAVPPPLLQDGNSELGYKIFDLDGGWNCVSYAPSVFTSIRGMFGLADPNYLNSLQVDGFFRGLIFGNWRSLVQMDTCGRSGSLLFKTDDEFLIIKSLPRSEAEHMLSILSDYCKYLLTQKDTLLTRFYGLYQLQTPTKSLHYFIVMENCIYTEKAVTEIYDLKGSTVNRSTPQEFHSVGYTLKDLDFLANRRAVVVDSDIRDELIEQIISDATFLCGHNILDYSLLVGIHFGSNSIEEPPPLKPKYSFISKFQSNSGGVIGAVDPPVWFFFGILDILTQWDYQKLGEGLLKSVILGQDSTQISAVPPPQYLTRFKAYIENIIIAPKRNLSPFN